MEKNTITKFNHEAIDIPVCLDNIGVRGQWNTFVPNLINEKNKYIVRHERDYNGLTKGKKLEFIDDHEYFQGFIRIPANRNIRNGIGHNNIRFDGETQQLFILDQYNPRKVRKIIPLMSVAVTSRKGETMAYSELIKNFNKVRDYMRDFYVYGFKSRDEYTKKSARSYDDEKRRIESWLGDYMEFHQTADGKNVFLSIDSRVTRHNPLYKAWKTKSFTDRDITLHFIIIDILADGQELSLVDIASQVDEYLAVFDHARVFDSSTIRKKLNEYVKEGLLVSRKSGKTMLYRRTEESEMPDMDVLDFFSETAPCGVIGSFLQDKIQDSSGHFAFKHHYITGAMDSEVLCTILEAIHGKRSITVEMINRKKDRVTETNVVPLRVMISVQSGRQYLMAYAPFFKRITSYRLDNIVTVKTGEIADRFDELREKLDGMHQHMWGVATDSRSGNRMEHIEFTVQYDDGEQHIPRRLEREKRIGVVEYIDEHTSRFSADVYDASELIPWVRTFICRITDISISNEALETQFKKDLQAMYEMYGLEGGDDSAVS